MGTLNTIFNWRSSVHNRDTAEAVTRLAHADRVRELRDRGRITPLATGADIARAEHVLAAQMRARTEEQSGRWSPYLSTVLVAVICAGVAFSEPMPLLWVLAALITAGFAIRTYIRERRRAAALERAIVRDGVCGWCHQRGNHVLEGVRVTPRVFHAAEIEAVVYRRH